MSLEEITIIVAIVTSVILLVTFLSNSIHFRHQTKIDIANFYSDYDTKLRDSDKELRLLSHDDHDQVYHYMAQIIVTLNTIILVKDDLKIDIDLDKFKEWFKYGLELTPERFEEHRELDEGDRTAIGNFIGWCNNPKHKIKPGGKIIPKCIDYAGYINENRK